MMPVRGDKVQKRVNERGRNYNVERDIINLGLLGRDHHGQQNSYLDMEDWEEIEALLEREQHLLGQHHHRSDPASVNLLHSPDQTLRPPLETLPRRSHTPRTIPRTHGSLSVPLNQLSSILLNMTFSDAEEDHQGSRSAREASQSSPGAEGNDRERSTSRSRTESGVSNASTASLVTPSSSGPAANGHTHAENSSMASTAEASGASNLEMSNAVQSVSVADMKGVDSKKIMEKLQQIQGYIQQTTTAMTALEQQGDTGSQSDIYNRFVTLNKSLQHQEGEYLDILARSLVLNKAAAQVANGCPNNESVTTPVNGREETDEEVHGSGGKRVVGVVGPGNVASLQERLAASQEESAAIMGRMRDSIARREDLMVRYKATRERLENLKKQQQNMRNQEEQQVHQPPGDSEEPYEDPIPGVENWTTDEINQGIEEFQSLFDKVDRLQGMYTIKAQNVDPEDEEAQASVAGKLSQLASKRRLLIDTITRLRRIQRQRQGESDAGDGLPGSQRNSTVPVETPESNQSTVPGERRSIALETTPRASTHSSDDISQINLNSTASNVAMVSDEISSRQMQLQTLQKQLGDMKKLLDVTTAARKEDERRMIESQKRLEEAEAAKARLAVARSEAERAQAVEGAVGGEVIEVAGRKVFLSEAERQNPEVMQKYQDISKAKERLNKMEEVMEMIASAKRNHQNLREVIPPDYLAILEEAEAERDEAEGVQRRPVPEVTSVKEEPEEEVRSSRRHVRSSRLGSASRSDVSTSLGRNERDHHMREKENSDISAMQKRLNKTSTRVSAINEGSKHGHEKGAVKKQPQALWEEGNSGVDPRVSEMLAMQEELRQKKNALEALMKRMGKSSSLNMDNISDNISDNVSETSDRLDGGNGTTATWGTAGLHDYSDNHYQHSSDEDLIEEENDDGEAPTRSHRRSQQPPCQPKDRNRHSATRHRRRQDSGRFSVNNLTTAHSGRPKHNRLRGSSVPKASWEAVGTMEGASFKSPSNTTLQAHQTLGAALSQLSQVQGTINNLQESLRQEQSQVLGSLPSPYSQFLPQYVSDLPSAGVTPSSLSNLSGIGVPTSGVQALTPMSPYAGLGSLAMGGQGVSETSGPLNQQVMMGLQQCFSQLHLHSLEIQALSKHLQLLDRREQVDSIPVPDSGNGRVDRRGARAGTRRSEEEEEDEEDDDDDEDVTAGSRPSYPLHHNLLAASLTREGKESVSRVPQSLSFPLFLGQSGEGERHSTGVTNPIYGRLGDIREHPGTWGSHAPTPGTEPSSEQLASMLEVAGIVDSSPSHPLLHLDRMSEERPQSQPPEDHHWATLPSAHPLHHQTTDLLNNQVPPGTRANNYWDNFRSYSRQNLLSTATKSNTSDHHPAQMASTSAATPSGTTGLHQSREGSRIEDKRFNVAVSHNNNSSSGAGARARISNPHINNPRGANPRVRNPVSSNSQQVHGQNKHKTNNRNKQSGWWMPSSGVNVPGTNAPPSAGSAGNSRDRSSVNYNFVRGNSTDSDGAGALTLEVLREAEALMRRHANQPEFLLQLFRHASQITVHTDQHVAVALLQDLAAQPHGSNHGVNANRPSSNNETNSLSLPAPLRDSSWHQQTSPSRPHNILPQENVSVVGLSGSEVSDSGLTSEDEDSRALYRNVKNLSLSPNGQVGLSGAIPRATPGVTSSSHPRPRFPQPQQYQPQFPQHNYQYFPQQHNLANNQSSSRSVANSESSLYDHLIFNDSHMSTAHPQQVVEEWMCQSEGGNARGEKLQNQPETVGSSPEDAHHITHPLNNDTEYLTFESVVSSAVRTSVEILQSQASGTLAAGGTVSPHLLASLHSTLIAQIQTQAQSLQLPQSFLFSVDTELKGTLQAFTGKILLEVSNDIPSVVSQVLLTQYCSVLVQRLRDNHPVLPQTPTKLSQSKVSISEAGSGNVASASSASHVRHTQENTTATQTESSVFSLTPHQHAGLSHATELSHRSNHHGSRTFSLTSSTGSSVTHGSAHSSHLSSHAVAHASIPLSSPHPPPHITASMFQSSSSGSSQWQVPLSAPLPSPNENGASVEALIDNSMNSMNAHQTSQPESWAASSSVGQMATESSAPASRPDSTIANNAGQANSGAVTGWEEPEHEEAMMDDIIEPTLPVHDLAEADQSQDAGGDWEDSQAEGIHADSAGAVGNANPQHSAWIQPREKSSQHLDAEGMVECDADAAEGTSQGAVGHHGYAEHLAQGATRELELDEVPTKLQSPEGGSPLGTPEHKSSAPHHQSSPPSHGVQPPHSSGSEG